MSLDPESLLASLVVSSIGFVLFRYGRKQSRFPQTAIGVAMLVYPYFITSVPYMLLVCAALLGLLWLMIYLRL
jgi:hypothetical protein